MNTSSPTCLPTYSTCLQGAVFRAWTGFQLTAFSQSYSAKAFVTSLSYNRCIVLRTGLDPASPELQSGALPQGFPLTKRLVCSRSLSPPQQPVLALVRAGRSRTYLLVTTGIEMSILIFLPPHYSSYTSGSFSVTRSVLRHRVTGEPCSSPVDNRVHCFSLLAIRYYPRILLEYVHIDNMHSLWLLFSCTDRSDVGCF